MSRRWVAAVLVSSLAIVIIQPGAWASGSAEAGGQTWYVATDGHDSGEGTVDDPFASWQRGIHAARAGDRIVVAAGTYSAGRHGVSIQRSGDREAKITLETADPARRPVLDCAGLRHVVRNNVALPDRSYIVREVDDRFNSWTLPVQVTKGDFRSTSWVGADGPRDAGGSLPHLAFLRLRAGSDLVDAGKDIGKPYDGAAPDLGAYERR